MLTTPEQWHQRFIQQSTWTAPVRQYLLSRVNIPSAGKLLEVGCGTGAVCASLAGAGSFTCIGLDFNLAYLRFAAQHSRAARFTAGNALQIPFAENGFDAVVCHFLLLWIPAPAQALREMARCTRPGGAVIAFAEPDYGGRIDFPPPLDELGRLQTSALRGQGADPNMGRQLSGLFHAAGLRDVETGLLGGQWSTAPDLEERASEWATTESDLAGKVPPERIHQLRQADEQAWQAGQRVLFVPTFYAIGWK